MPATSFEPLMQLVMDSNGHKLFGRRSCNPIAFNPFIPYLFWYIIKKDKESIERELRKRESKLKTSKFGSSKPPIKKNLTPKARIL